MQPLKNELPRSDDVLFVFYDFETTQDTKFSENATQHIPILVCIQQFCSICEMQEDKETDLNVVVGDAIHSMTTRSAIYYIIFANLDLGAIESWP
jgi:desulfoferrodoxin (superoxide reductase-like protein)